MKAYHSLIILVLSLLTATAVKADENGSLTSSTKKRQISALPTIEKCQKDRAVCLESCNNQESANCSSACPVCPIIEKVSPVVRPSADIINRNFIIDVVNETSSVYSVKHPASLNHTTVFKLHNYINNTNVIKIPTNVNNTNINNINVFANETAEEEGPFGFGSNETGSCCIAIQPKTCRYASNGFRCHHKRHKTCGPQCTSRLIHIQARNRCRGRYCSRGVSYIPQPQPSCFYTNYWPYVACGASSQRECNGCYDHYGYGYSSYQSEQTDCGGCYDDGFSYGQLYRRGPVLRPFYYHEPPCHLTGQCSYDGGYYNNGYGYFGHQHVDPVWGPESDQNENLPLEPNANVFEDDDEPDRNGTTSNWGVVMKKCKVVTENGTIKFEDCNQSKENPYAAAPAATLPIPYYPQFSPGAYPPAIYPPQIYLPPVYNPAIDYEFYARNKNQRPRAKASGLRNKRKVRRLLKRRVQSKAE